MHRLRAAVAAWFTRPHVPLDVASVRAYRDATHMCLGEFGSVFCRSNLERVLDNERYLASFDAQSAASASITSSEMSKFE